MINLFLFWFPLLDNICIVIRSGIIGVMVMACFIYCRWQERLDWLGRLK
jgi:hypothetical protein